MKRSERGLASGLCVLLACATACDARRDEEGTPGANASTGAAPADDPAAEPDEDLDPQDDSDPPCEGDACPDPDTGPGTGRPDDDGGTDEPDGCTQAYEACVEVGNDEAACAEARELCERPPDDGGTGDEVPPGSGDPCCEPARDQCVADGDETEVTCADIEAICVSGMCEVLVDVCPPDEVPVSEACAEAYNRCYGFTFLVNKCNRMSYDNCMLALDDAALCAAWDQSCASRETYCNDTLAPLGLYGSMYTCTDWGHGFDRCFEDYQGCTEDPSVCASALEACANAYIYTWDFQCSDGDPRHRPDSSGP